MGNTAFGLFRDDVCVSSTLLLLLLITVHVCTPWQLIREGTDIFNHATLTPNYPLPIHLYCTYAASTDMATCAVTWSIARTTRGLP